MEVYPDLPVSAADRPLSVRLSDVMPAGMMAMTFLGASSTLFGPSLVFIAAETGASLANLGILFLLGSLGFFSSTALVNRLARRFEMRRTVLLGIFLIALGLIVFISFPFPSNLLGALLIGYGGGTLEVLFNRLVELLAADSPAAALTRLHATWGLGAVLIPLIVAGVVWAGLNWRAAGLVLLAYSLLVAVIIWRWRDFAVPHGGDVHWRVLPWRSILFFVAMFAIYAGVESALGGWATAFFAGMGQGAIMGAIATSAFFLTFTIGRLVLAPLTDRLGFARTVRLGTALGAAALGLTFFPSLAFFGFALAGVALSTVFPTMLAWSARLHPGLRAQMASVSIASAGVGLIIIPYTVGLGVSALGLWSLTPILITGILIVCALSFFEHSKSNAPDAELSGNLQA